MPKSTLSCSVNLVCVNGEEPWIQDDPYLDPTCACLNQTTVDSMLLAALEQLQGKDSQMLPSTFVASVAIASVLSIKCLVSR